ncbi:MAG TPA: DnaJ domain-containing protein [Stenotrophomonas sp.]|nr:DnaJ domain-containing protein [Stenotrophomonas sp.]
MRWYGKLLGFIAGALLFRANPLFGALVGLLLGHAVDRGWFSSERDDPYRELGLTAEATATEIDLAYRRLMSQNHPDKLAGAAPELRQQAEERSRRINAAYDRIQRRRRR